MIVLRTFVVVALIVVLVVLNHSSKKSFIRNEYIPPAKEIVYLSFGFSEVLADALWLRVIQDLDHCSRLFSDAALLFSRDETDEVSGRIRCKRSWSFRMLDAITDLAPRFRMPAATGAMSLSVLLDDYEGANIIFDKAVRNFPNDWPILYRAAYHYLFDMNDRTRAAELMVTAADHGAPQWLRLSAARLMTEDGKAAFGLEVLKDYLKNLEDPEERKRVIERIEKIKESQVDLEEQ